MTQKDNGGALTQMDDYVYPGDRFTQSGMKPGHGMGMTLRDWFAGQALVGLCASPNNIVADGFHGEFATHAYMLADALLAARSAK